MLLAVGLRSVVPAEAKEAVPCFEDLTFTPPQRVREHDPFHRMSVPRKGKDGTRSCDHWYGLASEATQRPFWPGRSKRTLGAIVARVVDCGGRCDAGQLTDRVDARVLVVEGWVREYAFQASVRELETGRYEQVFTTGGPVIGAGGYSSDYNTAASVGAERLKAAGAPDELIQMAPSRVADRDRTFGSAVALCNWLRQHDRKVQAINVITEDTHARRTRLLFEKAFHGGTMVGVVSVPSPDYDAKHWWRYSQGIEDVVGQGSAYLYARLFFNPSPQTKELDRRLKRRIPRRG